MYFPGTEEGDRRTNYTRHGDETGGEVSLGNWGAVGSGKSVSTFSRSDPRLYLLGTGPPRIGSVHLGSYYTKLTRERGTYSDLILV